MGKIFTSLGLMSGTSGDGVDASLISSDGLNKYRVIFNQYFKFDQKIYENIHILKDKITKFEDLKKYNSETNELEREITLFHSKVVSTIISSTNKKIDLVGFHGQTIYHNSSKKISKQIGDAKLLSQLTEKVVINDFRKNDIQNGGEGAPLTPIFHNQIVKQKNIKFPVCILNIGGISNVSAIRNLESNSLTSMDLGPGNCLIDEWIRKNTKKKFDKNGEIAKAGKVDKLILNQALDNFENSFVKKKLSFDTRDFSLGFVRGLNLEDGTATLTDYTGKVIVTNLLNFLSKDKEKNWKILICGGGRKNKTLIEIMEKEIVKNFSIQLIDDYGVDGDYVESQAFAYIAIRSFLNLPITFPGTTGCKKPCSGGILTKNF
tara:strand:+ start:191 stop:1318 length:1128 start_codon:yes stop_codon:yes gene_type:complete